jgi:hypothetical protein
MLIGGQLLGAILETNTHFPTYYMCTHSHMNNHEEWQQNVLSLCTYLGHDLPLFSLL